MTRPVKAQWVVVGHGSRNPQANRSFEGVVEELAKACPHAELSFGYVELAKPSLQEALRTAAGRSSRVVVIPLFLFAAGHVKNDIPLVLASARREFPQVEFIASPPMGVHPTLVQELRRRLLAGPLANGKDPSKTAILMIGRGSSDPDANADFCKLARLVGEGVPGSWLMTAFMSIASPSVPEGLELIARTRPERVVVVPYLLFSGRLIERLSAQIEEFGTRYPWISIQLEDTLGNVPAVHQALQERAESASQGARPLPCDTCQYRVPIAGVESKVGGLDSLLWSVRHSFTHTQAMPHEHAHPPMKKHVLVCGNVECADKGSVALLGTLRRLIKKAGCSREIRVTKTHCMGRCGEGPTVAVYPDGVWYREVQVSDAQELVDEHLLNNRLVARIVDSMMQ